MFVRLLIIVVAVGLLLGGLLGLVLRIAMPPATAAVQATPPAQTQTYTGDLGAGGTTTATVTKVALSDKTTISKAVRGELADLKAGEAITVIGQAAADGTVTARSITIGIAGQLSQSGQQGQAGGNRPASGTIEKVEGNILTLTPLAPGQGQTAGTQGTPGQGQAGAQNTRPVAGTIENIEGTVLTINNRLTNSGEKVQIDDTTVITKYVTAAQSDLAAGQVVSVQGQAGSDGVMAATSLIIMNIVSQ